MLEQFRCQHARARRFRPDRGEMALARAFRTDQRYDAIRPIRPAVDQAQRGGVRRATQKILARKTFGMIKREHELTRTERTTHVA
jgi:hypothetical protein